MKKKLLAVLLISTMVFGLVACGDAAPAESSVEETTTTVADEVETETEVESETEAVTETEVVENGRIEFTLPASFTVEDETAPGTFYSTNYPEDTSNYSVSYAEVDPYTFNYTKEDYANTLREVFKSQYDLDIDVDCKEFTETTLDGHDVRIIRTSYVVQDIKIDQIQCAVQLEEGCETVTYTAVNGNDWTEEFEASMDSIHIVTE